jgi:hypothetical protein
VGKGMTAEIYGFWDFCDYISRQGGLSSFKKCLTLFQPFFSPSFLSLFVNPILHHTWDDAACSEQIALKLWMTF